MKKNTISMRWVQIKNSDNVSGIPFKTQGLKNILSFKTTLNAGVFSH